MTTVVLIVLAGALGVALGLTCGNIIVGRSIRSHIIEDGERGW